MRLSQRLAGVAFEFLMRIAPTRPINRQDLARADFSTHPGGKGLRFSERVRDAFRKTWLRLRR